MFEIGNHMILGYNLWGQDNESFLNPDLYEKNIAECLDFIANREKYITAEFKIKKTHFDYSYTYDAAIIVSQKFKEFCVRNNYDNIEFHKLIGEPEFYLFKAFKTIKFDSVRRNTTFIEYNEECNQYNEVVGATPVCLEDNEILNDGFYRTDIEFGRGYAKSPLILVGVDTFKKLKKEKIKGLDCNEVLDRYDWEI